MKPLLPALYTVMAESVVIDDDLLVFFDCDGGIAASLILNQVKSWIELPGAQDPSKA